MKFFLCALFIQFMTLASNAQSSSILIDYTYPCQFWTYNFGSGAGSSGYLCMTSPGAVPTPNTHSLLSKIQELEERIQKLEAKQ